MMADLELAIDRLVLTFDGGSGQAHRIQPIGKRAMVLLQTLVEQRMIEWGLGNNTDLEGFVVPPLDIDLTRTGDEKVARRLAEAMYAAVAAQLHAI